MNIKDILTKSEVIRTLISGPEPRDRPITLTHKNIFILPTKYGYIWFGLLCIMCITGLNYRNNLVLLCCFFLSTCSFVSLIYCFFQLYKLEILPGPGEDGFLGEMCCFNIFFREKENRTRFLELKCMDFETNIIVEPGSIKGVKYFIKPKKRGLFASPHFVLKSLYPFGLFRSWALVKFSTTCIIYPRPIPCDFPEINVKYGDEKFEILNRKGIEDFSELDKYTPPEPSSRIFWKIYAKNSKLVKKVFSGAEQGSMIFSISDFKDYPEEKALCFLCFLVLEASRQGYMFGLQLGQKKIPPGSGQSHKIKCLRSLALYEDH